MSKTAPDQSPRREARAGETQPLALPGGRRLRRGGVLALVGGLVAVLVVVGLVAVAPHDTVTVAADGTTTKRPWWSGLVPVIGGATATSAPNSAAADKGFITRSGTKFEQGGSPFSWVGFNTFGASGCHTGTPWSDDEIDAYFSSLPPRSVTRTWAFSHYGTDWLKNFAAKAAAHDQYLMLVLSDGNSNCLEYEGAPGGDGSGKTLDYYRSGWKGGFSDWVRTVVPMFADDPTVGMWQIMNEPGHAGDKPDAETMKTFIDGSAALIRSLDPNHLIGIGAAYSGDGGFDDYAAAHSGPNIDFIGFHDYSYQYEKGKVVSGNAAPVERASKATNKPWIVDETGAPSGQGCDTTFDDRSNYLREKTQKYFALGAGGLNFWDYEPGRFDGGCDLQINSGDPIFSWLKGAISG